VLDLPFGAEMAARLSLHPPDVAREAARRGKLPIEFKENLYEVLNIMAAAMNFGPRPHVRLHSLVAQCDDIPEEYKALFEKAPGRLDMEVDLIGIGRGKFMIRVS
jgi:hypothetical protein